MKRLREINGDELLVRTRNGMTPTERAEGLRPDRAALDAIDSILGAGRALRAGEVKAGLWRWCA